ncbi:MAG: uroporphyrinogen-III C-methyltransferase [Candidatus Syntropharchaeia archaeon]
MKKVYLVGAGPGDPDLLTLKAKKLIEKADVIVYDRLIGEEILKLLPEDAELIDVGKTPDHHVFSQFEINEILVKYATAGKLVVRLKGGDPYVFGRGGEEAEYLSERGIDFEVVPGITSAISVPAAVGIPVTHRRLSSYVTIVTGHEDPEKSKEINWEKLAALNGTLVILMGVRNLEKNVKALLKHGKDPKTLVAVIERSGERTTVSTLEKIISVSRKINFKPPAVIVIGNVVKLHEKLS